MYDLYRSSRRILRFFIKKSKANSWNELIGSIEDDPWGLPYKMVLNKLRRSGLGLSEELDATTLEKLLTSLFPAGEEHTPDEIWTNGDVTVDFSEVSALEVRSALKRGSGEIAWT